MSIIDYLRDFNSPQSGKKRRDFLENMFDFEEYVPPNLRAPTQFVLDANPVTGMGNSVTESRVAFDPTRSADERKRAGINMMMEVGLAAAPAVLGRMGYLTPPVALAETFAAPTPTSEGIRDATTGLLSDLQYGARSIAEGNPRGVLEAFQSGGQPTSLSAATVGSNMGPPLDIIQYSPTLQAAENLTQNKGTFEQMKSMLLKGGGKEEEIDWSGFNKQFRNNQVVTKDEIIKYFQDQDARLDTEVLNAGKGLTHSFTSEDVDNVFSGIFDQMLTRFEIHRDRNNPQQGMYDPIQEELEDGFGNVNNMPAEEIVDSNNNVRSLDVRQTAQKYGAYDMNPDDYSDLDIAEMAAETGMSVDEVSKIIKSGNGFNFEGDEGLEIFEDGLAFLKKYEPNSYNNAMEVAERSMFEMFRHDPPAFINSMVTNDAPPFGLGQIGRGDYYPDGVGDFDGGLTQFSQYFPNGANNYTETVFKYNPKTGEIERAFISPQGHFGGAGQIVHSRVGDFEIETGLNPGLVDNVRYIGEVQSDIGQSIQRSKRKGKSRGTAANYEETALVPKLIQANLNDDFSRSFENNAMFKQGGGDQAIQSYDLGNNKTFTNMSRSFIETIQQLSGYGYRSGYLNYTPEAINIITDNLLAHNLLLNHRGISNTAMLADPYKLKSIDGLDFDKIDHTDILDIVYNRRQAKNAEEASAFSELKTQFLENVHPDFQANLNFLNKVEPSEGFHISTFMHMVPLFGDFKMSNNFLYLDHKPDIDVKFAMEFDQPLTDIFEDLDFSALSKYSDRVREAQVDKIAEMNRFAEARGDKVNINRNGSPMFQFAGPTAKNEKQWAPYALRHEITKAVNDDVDVIALPYSKKSIGRAGGISETSVKDGSVQYYRENLVNYFTDIFKKFDPKFAKEIKEDIASGEFGLKTEGETAVGFKLTKEMKDKIRARGVPTFGVAGGIGLTDYMLQDEQRQQPNSLLGGI
jgi:hypothetical protein